MWPLMSDTSIWKHLSRAITYALSSGHGAVCLIFVMWSCLCYVPACEREICFNQPQDQIVVLIKERRKLDVMIINWEFMSLLAVCEGETISFTLGDFREIGSSISLSKRGCHSSGLHSFIKGVHSFNEKTLCYWAESGSIHSWKWDPFIHENGTHSFIKKGAHSFIKRRVGAYTEYWKSLWLFTNKIVSWWTVLLSRE